MTNLDDAQKKQVAGWVAEGLKISEVQSRIESTFGIRMTYMDVRFLLDDLKMMPKDAPPPQAPKTVEGGKGGPPIPKEEAAPAEDADFEEEAEAPAGTGRVSVSVDTVTRPGAMVSGSVKFSDGKSASWFLDQYGRLGLAAKEQGYRPPEADLREFQTALQSELAKLGF